ncbi:MAG: hypothetical protein AAF563_11780 [Pseudomonadota bacterium]
MRQRVVSFALAAVAFGALATVAAPAVTLADDNEPQLVSNDDLMLGHFSLDEDFEPVWPVAGEVVVGVMARWSQSAQDDMLLTILAGSRPEAAQLCIEVVSRSGEYDASTVIRLGADVLDPVRLNWAGASEQSEDIRALDPVDVAVSVVEEDCGNDGAAFLLASWGGFSENDPDSIDVLVNAKTSDASISLSANGVEVGDAACDKVEDPRRLGYDFVCHVALDGPLPDVDHLEGIVIRKQFGSAKLPDFFTISLRGTE